MLRTTDAIEPKDIVAVEYECLSCGARSTRKLAATAAVPGACGSCNQPYLQNATALQAFLTFLANYDARPYPFALRFEVAGMAQKRESV